MYTVTRVVCGIEHRLGVSSANRMLSTNSRLRAFWCRVTRWPLGLLFAYSGTIKLIQLPRFSQHVGDFGIVFDSLVKPVAIVVCILELVSGVALVLHARWAVPAVASLLICFVAVLSYGISMGLDIECGCLGSGYGLQLGPQLLIDLVLLGWCILIHWSRKHSDAITHE